jgi:hypothetical protein
MNLPPFPILVLCIIAFGLWSTTTTTRHEHPHFAPPHALICRPCALLDVLQWFFTLDPTLRACPFPSTDGSVC